jgi:prepilin-type N-terminal cleavage/methylation domain-containing protein
MNRVRPRSRHAGFTLLEVIMTVTILSIVFVLGSKMMGKAYESYDLEKRTTSVDWQGRLALERMMRELRGIRSSADVTLPASSNAPIFFTDIAGGNVCFCYESVSATVRRGTSTGPSCGTGGVAPTASCGTGSTRALAGNVDPNGLNFYFYDANGNATASAASLQLIGLSLAVRDGNVAETYRASVQPRGLP